MILDQREKENRIDIELGGKQDVDEQADLKSMMMGRMLNTLNALGWR